MRQTALVRSLFLSLFLSLAAGLAGHADPCTDDLTPHPSDADRIKRIEGMRREDMPIIARSDLTELQPYWPGNPERDGGSTVNMSTAIFNGVRVLVKEAPIQEAKKALLLSETKMGIPFFGVTDFCNCYVTEYIPEAMVLKSWRFDSRATSFKARGFHIGPSTMETIEHSIRRLAQMGFYVGDVQFLITLSGDAFAFDPGGFVGGGMAPSPNAHVIPLIEGRDSPTVYAEKAIVSIKKWAGLFESMNVPQPAH